MNWKCRKPTAPGLYWYRSQHSTPPPDFETFKIVWDESMQVWVAQTHGRGSIPVESCNGEWYGPITPPDGRIDGAFAPDHGRNTRIAVRLQHGGSFYFDNTIPDGVAISLSEKLKALHTGGNALPVPLRARVSGLLRELIRFANAPPDRC